MPTPTETVERFLAMLGVSGGFHAAIREMFTEQTVYENIGLSTTTGIAEALAFADSFGSGLGVDAIRVETLAIAAAGSTVLTERIDHVVNARGETTLSIRLMGVFEVAGDKIIGWRDYFDTVPFQRGG